MKHFLVTFNLIFALTYARLWQLYFKRLNYFFTFWYNYSADHFFIFPPKNFMKTEKSSTDNYIIKQKDKKCLAYLAYEY